MQTDLFVNETRTAEHGLVGLKVRLARGCDRCGHGVLVVGAGKGPHRAALHCALCRSHAGWLSTEAALFIEEIIAQFGRPTAPIEVRRVVQP